jgi:hypothetical protein
MKKTASRAGFGAAAGTLPAVMPSRRALRGSENPFSRALKIHQSAFMD